MTKGKVLLYFLPAALFLLAGVYRADLAGKADAYVRHNILQMRNELANTLIFPFSQLGSASVMAAVFIVTAAVLLLRRRMAAAFWLFASISVSYGLNTFLKEVYARPRPEEDRLVEADGFSFPSGNAMIGTSFYLMIFFYLSLAMKKPWILVIGAAFVFSLGFCRVYLGVHYPLDILGGFAAGTFLFILCRTGYKRSLKRNDNADNAVDV